MSTPRIRLQERLDRQAEDRFWNEHRAQDALHAKRIAEQRIQDDLGLLRPGERIVDGMVMYSSLWLGDPCAECGEEGRHKGTCSRSVMRSGKPDIWLDDVPENELARRRAQKP
jgi:hypothetical protein